MNYCTHNQVAPKITNYNGIAPDPMFQTGIPTTNETGRNQIGFKGVILSYPKAYEPFLIAAAVFLFIKATR